MGKAEVVWCEVKAVFMVGNTPSLTSLHMYAASSLVEDIRDRLLLTSTNTLTSNMWFVCGLS